MIHKEIEYECLICGDHMWHTRERIVMCEGCNNGIMKPYIPE
jgi:DNA-directed RNA polymerase subunit RPC12/RpoP